MSLSRLGQKSASATLLLEVWKLISNRYDAETNPTGCVNVGVAESELMQDEICKWINEHVKFDGSMMGYGDGGMGSTRLRKAMARFLNKHLKPVTPIEDSHVIVTGGVTSAIEQCSFLLSNPGECWLLGRPYYRAFIEDISNRVGNEVLQVSFGKDDPFGPQAAKHYEDAILKAKEDGKVVKGLMLCHPHNPLGRYYPKRTMIELMKVCEKHRIHFVSDEIYALSIFAGPPKSDSANKEDLMFHSALSIDLEGIIDPKLVHVLWGMSKDFAASGIRIGCVITQHNKDLQTALIINSPQSYPSSIADRVSADMLNDDAFTDYYIAENQRRLAAAHAFARGYLDKHGIEYSAGVVSTFFMWLNVGKEWHKRHPSDKKAKNGSENARPIEGDMSNLVFEVDDETAQGDEKQTLSAKIFKRCVEEGVFVTDGDAAGSEEDGWMRIVVSHPEAYMREGLDRILKALD